MSFIKRNIAAFIALLFTIAVLVPSFMFAYNHYDSETSLAEIGGFISGVFAPVAWAWFLASYSIQSSELRLQRRELKLQRKAIEESTKAQQGSERALKAQSEALTEQLAMSQKQFAIYIRELEAKEPKFIISKMGSLFMELVSKDDDECNSFQLDDDIRLGELKNSHSKISSIRLNFYIKNVGAFCQIISITNSDINVSYINTDYKVISKYRQSPNTFKHEEKDRDYYYIEFGMHFPEFNRPTLNDLDISIDELRLNILENINFDLVCRVGESVFTYSYKVDKRHDESILIKKASLDLNSNLEEIPLDYKFDKGYDIFRYEKTDF